jgi:hypothetical protein
MPSTIPVTAESFIRAESDLYFGTVAVKRGGFGTFEHRRAPADVADQSDVRMSRDTLYSAAVIDLDATPVTITLPAAGTRGRAVGRGGDIAAPVSPRSGAHAAP